MQQNSLLRLYFFVLLALCLTRTVNARTEQRWKASSPGGINEIVVALDSGKNLGNTDYGEDERLYFKVSHHGFLVIPWSPLGVQGGLEGANMNFVNGLDFTQADPVQEVVETYYIPHGKRREDTARSNLLVLRFANSEEREMHVVFKIFDDGVAFSYYFPGKGELFTITGMLLRAQVDEY